MCVGLVYQGVALPLECQSLQKPGTSNTEERKHLLTRALAYLDPRTCCLVADHAFIGRDWVAFLLDPSIDFVVRLSSNTHIILADGRQRSRALLDGFAAHLREAGLGTVSEIFDAEPPFAPRGCIAQAWSVAELLRAGVEDVGENGPVARV